MHSRNRYFPMVTYNDAGPELRALYDDIMAHFNVDFVLNYFKAQGANLELLKGNWGKIKSVLFSGTVPRLIKEEIIFRISKQENCRYCMYVHSKIIEALQAKIQLLKDSDAREAVMLTSKEEAAITLMTKLAADGSADIQSYCDQLIALDFTPEQVPELLAVVDLSSMLIMQANTSGIAIDEELLHVLKL
ncbi:hypothetical protein SG34_014880 [Thalassomonas viridans]|uniref:Carboxymuconolactone decarboxylase-like domain-containing protein n=1 Tax=Thalassomonas viridans TaxID=137584 RepID=A0AAE9ZA53_9GAMM|nr:hypothetical protein [Thalassomonas viridans]WDE08063.1 hypothetical protein SG34_014880 [Thalassomonas viridans]